MVARGAGGVTGTAGTTLTSVLEPDPLMAPDASCWVSVRWTTATETSTSAVSAPAMATGARRVRMARPVRIGRSTRWYDARATASVAVTRPARRGAAPTCRRASVSTMKIGKWNR